jgi:hypothetical protein
MSETANAHESTRCILNTILDALKPSSNSSGNVAFYTDIAIRLSSVVYRSKPWGWRYVQGVDVGTIQPGKLFIRAVQILGATLDGIPQDVANTEPVQIYAKPGLVKPGSIVLAASRSCKRPACPIHFIPSVPWQHYHSAKCRKLHYQEKPK